LEIPVGVVVPVGEVQVVLRWLAAGDPEEMVSTFGISGRGPYSSAQDVAVSVAAITATELCPATLMASGYTFVGVTAYVQQDAFGAEVGESLVNIAGSGGWSALPNNCAVLVRKRTASAGRQGRGRLFLPPYRIGEDDVDLAGVIDGGAIGSLQSEIDDWVLALETAFTGDDLVLFHQDGDPTPITSWGVDNKLATVRRRMRR
jgi:hypothetical protein